MIRRFLALPLLLQILMLSAFAMLLPAAFAVNTEAFRIGRMFFYSAILLLTVSLLVAIAISGNAKERTVQSQLPDLMAAFVLLPLILAVPFYESLQNTDFLNAYFEMVSSLTTTGATLFEDPGRLPAPLHLWRAEVAWLGGFLIWVAAAAIMAPLNLGGFELRSGGIATEGSQRFMQYTKDTEPSERLRRIAATLFPIYLGLTMGLAILLLMTGETPLVALCHAMSVLSTSGISPVGGLEGAQGGLAAEFLIFVFLGFSLTRRAFAADTVLSDRNLLWRDPELRLGLSIVALITALLFLRHWIGAFEVDEEENLAAGLQALWGAIFTVFSFLSTTGFTSNDWGAAQGWSGLGTPGVLLMGLAVIGGGVATTAGGVKLLRVFALYRHGVHEMERLIHPSAVGSSTALDKSIKRKGAFVAWIFFMLFALSIALLTVAFAAFGVSFEDATLLTIAGLSTTGPLVPIASGGTLSLIELSAGAKLVMAFAMVLGRLETFVIIAFFNPELWRNR